MSTTWYFFYVWDTADHFYMLLGVIHTYLFRRTCHVVVDSHKKVQGGRFRRHTAWMLHASRKSVSDCHQIVNLTRKKRISIIFRTSIICCLVVISQLSWVRLKQLTVFLLNNTIYCQTRLSKCGSRSCQSQEKSCSGHLSHVRTLESSNISLKISFVIATGPVVSVAFSSHSASNTG